MRTIGLIFTFVVFLLFLTILALIGALFGLFFAPVWLFVAAGALVALSSTSFFGDASAQHLPFKAKGWA